MAFIHRSTQELAQNIIDLFRGYVSDVIDLELDNYQRDLINCQQDRSVEAIAIYLLEQTGNQDALSSPERCDGHRTKYLAAAIEIFEDLFARIKRSYGTMAVDTFVPQEYNPNFQVYGKALSEKREVKAVIDAIKELCREPSLAVS